MEWAKEKSNSKAWPQPTGHPVSGQAPHLAARPGEAAKGGILMGCIIIMFTSLALEGVYKRLSLYEVLTRKSRDIYSIRDSISRFNITQPCIFNWS